MSAEYKFNFFVVQLAREEYNSGDPNKTIFVKTRFLPKTKSCRPTITGFAI